jgi:thymidylate synthase
MNVQDIRDQFIEKYQNKDFEVDKTGVKTIDIVCSQFEADENHIFGIPNEDYQKREIQWYLSKSLNVNDIPGVVPKIWTQVADPSGFINSNYGWMVFSEENGNQYDHCIDELKRNRSSRRAAMIYNRPSIWNEYNKNGMSDFICTYATQLLIRNDVLYYYVLMRSNDSIFGFNNDKAWHQYVLDKLSIDLDVKKTKMIWNSGSLHIYERHFYLIDHYIKTGETFISLKDYNVKYNMANGSSES